MMKDSLHFFCGSLALGLLLGSALFHLVAAFRQDSGLAYSEYATTPPRPRNTPDSVT